VPDCGEWRGRRVHAVEALNCGASVHWTNVPLPERNCQLLRQGSVDYDGLEEERARRDGSPSSAVRASTRRAASVSPERVGTSQRNRAESSVRTREFLASLGDDPLDRLFAAAIARRDGRK
jgi:hypothetical protein